MKKLLVVLINVVILNLFTVFVYAAEIDSIINVDEVILNAGVEAEVLENFSEEDKYIIADAIINDGAVYQGTSTAHFILEENDEENTEDDEFVEVNPFMRGTISSSDLEFSLTSFYGNSKYYITGTYEWLKPKFLNISDHVFSMSLPSGWKIDGTTIIQNSWYYYDYALEWQLIDSVRGRAYDISDNSVTWSSLSFKGTVIPLTTKKLFKGSCTIQTTKTGSTKEIKLQYGYSAKSKSISVTDSKGYGVSYSTSDGTINQATEIFKVKKQ